MDVFKILLYSLLIFNVTLKFFTNHLNVIPRILNVVDIMIVLLFLVLFITYRFENGAKFRFKNVLMYVLLFNAVMFFGSLLNWDYFHYKPAVSQIIMFNEPIILFLILVNLPFSIRDIKMFGNLLLFLICFEVIIGIMQVPIYLKTGESESLMGTFQHNAEQYAAFIMLGVFYLIGKVQMCPERRTFHAIIALVILSLILLIDNKASWLGVMLSIFYLLDNISRQDSGVIQKAKYLTIFVILSVIAFSVVIRTSASLHKFEGLSQAWHSGNFLNIGKIKAYRDVFSAYHNYPHMFFIGSGPGTFYSRAGRQFYNISESMYYSPLFYKQETKEVYRTSDSMGGVIGRTLTNPFYKQFYDNDKIYCLGSGTTDEPFSSYVGLLGETGIIGTFLYLAIYITVLRKLSLYLNRYKNDPNIFLLIAACVGCVAYTMALSVYRGWFEVGRMTTILWSMIAMVFRYPELYQKNEIERIL
ncbi:MAG: hypothetical protein LWX55_08285 [Deltaproteobacteria bacterium]|jgi:hypothetical protein|nr:hypothetical protein [Deltaproteobacteria bacterium]